MSPAPQPGLPLSSLGNELVVISEGLSPARRQEGPARGAPPPPPPPTPRPARPASGRCSQPCPEAPSSRSRICQGPRGHIRQVPLRRCRGIRKGVCEHGALVSRGRRNQLPQVSRLPTGRTCSLPGSEVIGQGDSGRVLGLPGPGSHRTTQKGCPRVARNVQGFSNRQSCPNADWPPVPRGGDTRPSAEARRF